MSKVETTLCAWRSHRCEPPVRPHVVSDGRRSPRELELCRFHGQAWPRVGEDPAAAEKRTHNVQLSLTQSARETGNERRRKNEERARRRREEAEREREVVDTGDAT